MSRSVPRVHGAACDSAFTWCNRRVERNESWHGKHRLLLATETLAEVTCRSCLNRRAKERIRGANPHRDPENSS